MNLLQLADALSACALTDPWPFDGSDLLETLTGIELTESSFQAPLPLNVELNDRFIVVHHTAHVPESFVRGFANRRELEAFILGPAGPTNSFTTFCVGFVDGSYCPYRLLYLDGTRDIEFSKAAQLEHDDFGHHYPELRLEWLRAAQRRP